MPLLNLVNYLYQKIGTGNCFLAHSVTDFHKNSDVDLAR